MTGLRDRPDCYRQAGWWTGERLVERYRKIEERAQKAVAHELEALESLR